MNKQELEEYRQLLADEASTYGEDLQASDTRMGTFALAVRDAYWNYRSWIGKGMQPDDLPADASLFEAWRYSQLDDETIDELFEEVTEPLFGGGMGYFERDLSEQILNASVPQIREYYEYASRVEENADDEREPWEGMGFVHVWRDERTRPREIVVSRVWRDGGATAAAKTYASDTDAIKHGIKIAFEAMLPCLVGNFVTIWQPWLAEHGPSPNAVVPPSPELAARALVALRETNAYGATKLEPGLAYLMTPVDLGRFALDAADKDFDGEFWAGELVGELVAKVGVAQTRDLLADTWLAEAV